MEKREALSTKPEECRYSFFQHTACEFFPATRRPIRRFQLPVLLLSPVCPG